MATKNSTESELVGLSDTETDIAWAQNFITVMGVNLMEPILYQDNTSTITIVKEGVERRLRSKHLTARWAVLHESIVTNNESTLTYKKTKVMLADPFTKPLEGASYQLIMNVIMGWMTINYLEKRLCLKYTGVRWDPSIPGSKIPDPSRPGHNI